MPMENVGSEETNATESGLELPKDQRDAEDLTAQDIEEAIKDADNDFDKETEAVLSEGTDSMGMTEEDVEKSAQNSGLMNELGKIEAEENEISKKAIEAIEKLDGNEKAPEKSVHVIRASRESESEDGKREIENQLSEMAVRKISGAFNNILTHVESEEYLNKLVEEVGNTDDAKKIQEQRIRSLKQAELFYIPDERELLRRRMYPKGISMAENYDIDEAMIDREVDKLGDGYVSGFYNSSTHEIALGKLKKETALHELLHAASMRNMPDGTKTLLEVAYSPSGNKKIDDYFGNPDELLVRKQIMDFEMERLGIKKYGEKFTREHYDKLKEAVENDEFSTDAAKEIMMRIKPGMFEHIFNGIADGSNKKEADLIG